MTQIARSRYGIMEASAAKPAFEVHGPASIHITDEPQKPEPGTLLDSHGEKVEVRRGWMVRVDDKAKEQITLSRGTIWLLGTFVALVALVPAILTLLLVIGGLLIGYGREDGTQAIKIASMEKQSEEIRDDMKELNRKFDDIQKSLNERAVQNAGEEGEVRGYKLKSAEGKHGQE